MLHALVGIVASTPLLPRAKSKELQLLLSISAYTLIYCSIVKLCLCENHLN